MATVSDKEIGLARVYARALLELAEDRQEADNLLRELLDLLAMLEKSKPGGGFFTSPLVDSAVRTQVIEKAFRGRCSDLLVDALQVINRKERLVLFPAIVEQFRLAHEDLRGRVDVHVRTATPLTDDLRRGLREAAKAYAGREADLVETVDEAVIGGMVVHIGDRKFDTSVATALRRLAGQLAERAAREIHAGKDYFVEAGT